MAAIRYRLLKQATLLSIFFVWWGIFGFVLPLIALLITKAPGGTSADITIPLLIFTVIASFTGIYSDFKFFIQTGMNRQNIFLVNLVTTVITSLGTGLLMTLISQISLKKLDLSLILTSDGFYDHENIIIYFILNFSILLVFSTMGLLLGTFNDMFSGVKKIIILLSVMSVPIILSITMQLAPLDVQLKWRDFIKAFIGYSRETGFSALPIIGTLLVVSIFFFTLFYILNRSHQIRRRGA